MKTSLDYENSPVKSVSISRGWMQGFIAAVCILIRNEGCVTTAIRDLWKCGGTPIHLLDPKKIEASDIELLKQHEADLK